MGVIQRQASRSVQVIRPGTAHQLGHGAAALPQGGGHTVAGGIASADDNHIQPGGGGNRRLRLAELSPLHSSLQVLGAVAYAGDAGGVQSQGPGRSGPAAEDHRVVLRQQPLCHGTL